MRELLSVQDLSAGYEGRTVLNHLSFSVREGELIGLLGPNGSGKSTLLKAVCGLIPCRGSCRSEGLEVRSLSASVRASRIAYLSAESTPGLEASCRDILRMGLYPELGLFGRTDLKAEARIDSLLEAFGLTALSDRNYRTLSSGEKQLIRILRTLLRKTPLLLLDEPDQNLDPARRKMLFGFLKKRAAETRCGILLASHDTASLLREADRLLLLKEGKMIAALSPACTALPEMEDALTSCFGPVEVYRHGGSYRMD